MARTGQLSKGHHVNMDNYCTSSELFHVLSSYDTCNCGTVCDRTNLYFKGRTIFWLKYHDKCDVHMLLRIHEAKSVVTDRINRLTNQPVMKQVFVVGYVQKMGGVDLSDQSIQYEMRKMVEKLYFPLYNLILVHASRMENMVELWRNIHMYTLQRLLLQFWVTLSQNHTEMAENWQITLNDSLSDIFSQRQVQKYKRKWTAYECTEYVKAMCNL